MVRIGFGTGNNFRSRLIQWVTRSAWTHVWVEYESREWGGWWVAHASARGVVKVPAEKVYREYTARKIYECDVSLTDGFDAVRNYIGANYDYGSVIWNGIVLLLSRVFARELLMKIVTRNGAKFSCSEFVSIILQKSKVLGGLDPELTTPGDLEKLCAESDHFTRIG